MNYEDIHSRDMLAFALGIPIKQLTGLLYGVKIVTLHLQLVRKMEVNVPSVLQIRA